MKRTSLTGLSLVVLALGSGCSSASSAPSGNKVDPQNIAEATSSLDRNTSPSVASGDMNALAQGNTAFATDMYKSLAKGDANLFYSPYSISSALAMTYAGAGGQTATEMAQTLHFSLGQDKLHPAFDALDLDLASRANDPVASGAKPVQLHVANSLFGYTQEKFGQPFLDTIKQNYGAGIRLLDFVADPEASRGVINGWVADETANKIEDLLPQGSINGGTRLVLVDAIYFDGNWDSPFQKSATQPASFTKVDATKVSVPMMEQTLTAPFAQTADFDAVELPYAGGKIAMDIIVPKDGKLASFEAGLDGASLAKTFSSLKSGPVDISLPKFKIAGESISLSDTLKSLGMKTAFTGSADFSAIAIDPSGPLYIHDVFHKAYVSVDEDGTEAAAATAVIIGTGSAPEPSPPPPAVIRCDKPFFFALRDVPTGTVLFAGRVTDPSAAQ